MKNKLVWGSTFLFLVGATITCTLSRASISPPPVPQSSAMEVAAKSVPVDATSVAPQGMRPVVETKTKLVNYTVMTPVYEKRQQEVSYTVMKPVYEKRQKTITYTVCTMVPETKTKMVDYTTCRMVRETRQKSVEYQEIRYEPIEDSQDESK